MKKALPLFLVCLLIVPIAFADIKADIKIAAEQHAYNLGNKIRVSASVLGSADFEGRFKLAIACDNYKFEYFLTPISLESGFRTAVNIPEELKAKPSMLGNCTIIGSLLTDDSLAVGESQSNGFIVTKQLTVLPSKARITSLPGEKIEIFGLVSELFGNNVLQAAAKASLNNRSYTSDAMDGKFNFTLYMPNTIKSGKHAIEIAASDSKGNAGSSFIELEITPVPNYIKTELSDYNIAPGSKIYIVSSLYDQADELINDSLDLELKSPNGGKIFGKSMQSNDKTDYEFSQYAEPGIYILASAYKNLFTQALINITAVREVKIRYGNETILIENVGNIPFEDELTFILESGLNKYPITKKIKVEPGKMVAIDLSKEVPLGIYNVLSPIRESIGYAKEKINETVSSLLPEKEDFVTIVPNPSLRGIAANVTIHDNRHIYKKIAGSLSSISGSLVGADGILTKNPLAGPMILATVVLLIILRYGGKPLLKLIKGKKNDDSKGNK